MYCMECGSKLEENAIVCPYCGQENIDSKIPDEKDLKIQELEQKVDTLEKSVKEKTRSLVRKTDENRVQPWIFIFPMVFFVLFFVFFIILVAIR